MPSARIMTHAVEDAYPLAEDLRTRGFVVQIVSFDRIPAGLAPVDLEVTLEECDPEAALHRADHVPEGDDLCVFVAPGALTDSPRPIRIVSLIPEIPASATPAPGIPAAQPPIETPETPTPAPMQEAPVVEAIRSEVPMMEAANDEIAAAALSSLMREDTAAAAPPVQEPILLEAKQETLAVTEAPKPQVIKVAPVAAPVAASAGMDYGELAMRAWSWMWRLRGDERLLVKSATVAAMGAVITVSVLVLGSTVHRLDPLSPAVHSASDSVLLPAAASAPVTPRPQPQTTKVKMPALRAAAPAAHSAPKPVTHSARNPEEDIVAEDTVIHYGNRPPAARPQAKKSAAVKHYSDLQQ